MSKRTSTTAYLLVLALFLFSGFSSLIYQVVWTRLLVLVFGSTTYATSTVLGVFMGGLALGSFIAGRLADRIKKPLLWYGILEGIIGLWALLVPILFQLALNSYRHLGEMNFATFSTAILLEAAAILIIPTTCMGATLPLLARFLTDSLSIVGQRVGTIYATNTLGAVLGTLAAGFILLPALGMSATTTVAALLNILLLVVVLFVSSAFEKSQVETESTSAGDTTGDAVKHRADPRVMTALFAIAVSGAAAMLYEVCWTRTLSMVIGSSTYAFTIMLATFLTGIFLGSLAMAWVADRVKKPVAWFGIFQLLICLACLVSMHLLPYLPWWNLLLNRDMPQDSLASLRVRLILSACTLLPLTACLGAIFPLVVKSCATDLKNLGRSVGTIYSFNTIGAIIGALLTGFVLVPLLGVERTLLVSCAVNLIVGLILISVDSEKSQKRTIAFATLGCIAALACVFVPHLWDRTLLLVGQTYRRTMRDGILQFSTLEQWKDFLATRSVVYYKDGPCSTVGVLNIADSDATTCALVTNGCIDAGDGPDMVQQVTLGIYPMLWRPNIKDVCVIGWGSGVTTGELLQFPVRSITAIELEPAVLEASYFFRSVNYLADRDKRVKIEYNDGRNYLLATNKKFDLIVSEPSNPWQVGVCNLFTSEYFGVCKERLNTGGTLAVWMQLTEVSPSMTRCVLASLKNKFRYCVTIAANEDNIIVLASDEPLKGSWQNIRDGYLSNAAVKRDLSRLNIGSPEAILARIVATAEGLDGVIRGAPENTDNRNYLEYVVGETYENKTFYAANDAMFDNAVGDPSRDIDWGTLSNSEIAEVKNRVAAEATRFERPELAKAWSAHK